SSRLSRPTLACFGQVLGEMTRKEAVLQEEKSPRHPAPTTIVCKDELVSIEPCLKCEVWLVNGRFQKNLFTAILV
ncbi:MAG: hypothetical protein GY805_36935, partial [Chloroflexi bacterium]|nr:hypothetical protein [Chloroflexota bacterium]